MPFLTPTPGPLSGPARGQGFERVVGPVVFRVATAHLLADLEVAGFPETGQIARDLHRALRGREELEDHGHGALADPRGRGETEDFLQTHGDARCVVVRVVDAH